MAVILRMGLLKGMNSGSNLLCAAVVPTTNSRSIVGKAARDAIDWPVRPTPFPYRNKYYTLFRSLVDRTTHRFNENSKIILIEGSIASGKTELAKQLAEDLDMLHMPEPTLDLHYTNSYGFDLRQLDSQIPKDCRSYDHTNFCKDPHNRHAAGFQMLMYSYRYSQYIDGLCHLMNTGQGVVMERSPFSDIVFAEAMVQSGFIRKEVLSVYRDVKKNTICELMKPHLVIYLDVPVKIIQDRVKKRNYPHEQNSKVMSTEHLTKLERLFKQSYLKEISRHSELLVYDWSEKGDTEVVIEDLENIDFENYNIYDLKCKDWRMKREQQWADMRMYYTNSKPELMNLLNVPRFDVPELITSADDAYERNVVYMNHPGMKYAHGYNEDMGDTGLLTKSTGDIRDEKFW